jgi:phosphoribosyl-ATP pyrophosphohydrolase/phosphoribosyl-AMP cyclohydrolase
MYTSGYEDQVMSSEDLGFLRKLESIIANRLENPSHNSYTSDLVAQGPKRVAQKVGEEGVELALAAVAGDRDEVINEAADLLYHTLVLLGSHRIELASVVARLEARHAP